MRVCSGECGPRAQEPYLDSARLHPCDRINPLVHMRGCNHGHAYKAPPTINVGRARHPARTASKSSTLVRMASIYVVISVALERYVSSKSISTSDASSSSSSCRACRLRAVARVESSFTSCSLNVAGADDDPPPCIVSRPFLPRSDPTRLVGDAIAPNREGSRRTGRRGLELVGTSSETSREYLTAACRRLSASSRAWFTLFRWERCCSRTRFIALP
mmetsp:Transcript_28163/g.76940  ORF Transcript_28163/g.76940 Transcript_28163/m.76940 type:complete len:217 (+) Transcript_28163:170-820(+)